MACKLERAYKRDGGKSHKGGRHRLQINPTLAPSYAQPLGLEKLTRSTKAAETHT
ncbi:hypothetical protein ARMGADRAFT_1013516 [Armillaria gallica]|uniref:Uncharacterized protein n=1 Tax=Armillaria gallica TaxID=47427 RepID=A0A2H3DVJ5_ARMGA|nr:hypothetical protein ARMGADRAFT_1013516 [Armillaria gallica]